jgi:hypothetical protein
VWVGGKTPNLAYHRGNLHTASPPLFFLAQRSHNNKPAGTRVFVACITPVLAKCILLFVSPLPFTLPTVVAFAVYVVSVVLVTAIQQKT